MIGVFDSGHGGLTVLRALTTTLPGQPFVYLGDHAAAPYGNRPAEVVYQLTVAGVERLFRLGCRLVVLACNTASAVALRRLQQTWLPKTWPGNRVLGVLVPMVEAITGMPWMADVPAGRQGGVPRTVGIFATLRTVDSQAYPREIGRRAPEVTVIQQACPDLARLIEDGAPGPVIADAVAGYAAGLLRQVRGEPLDAVMLGCTHYPLVSDAFAAALPAGVAVMCQPTLTARSLHAYLAVHPEFDGRASNVSDAAPQFFTTGDPDRITALASRFFGRPATFRRFEA